MAETETLPPSTSPSNAGDVDESLSVEPLTRGDYRRLPAVERQIAGAVKLDPPVLVQRALQRDENDLDFLSAEALVYFIAAPLGMTISRLATPYSANCLSAANRTSAASFGALVERIVRTYRAK